MLAKELMTRTVATVQPHDTLSHAAALMQQRECGCVIVIDRDAHPLAMLTDRDICFAALATDRPLSTVAVSEFMGRRPHVCQATDSIDAIEDAMGLYQVRRLPVVDDADRLVGIVALDDIARAATKVRQLFAPPVSATAVGLTLGEICRPHIVEGN